MQTLRVGYGSEHTHEDFLKMLMEQILPCDICYVYNGWSYKHAVRKTQIDRQEEKKIYTHDTDS